MVLAVDAAVVAAVVAEKSFYEVVQVQDSEQVE